MTSIAAYYDDMVFLFEFIQMKLVCVCVSGIPGEKGVQGLRGIKGPVGVDGVQGEKGDIGPTGPRGKSFISHMNQFMILNGHIYSLSTLTVDFCSFLA